METGFISSCQVTVQLIRPPAAPLFHLSLGKLSLKKQEHMYSMNHAHDDIISVYLSLSLSFLCQTFMSHPIETNQALVKYVAYCII